MKLLLFLATSLIGLTSSFAQVLNVTTSKKDACSGSNNGSMTITVDNTTTTAAPYTYLVVGIVNGTSGPFAGSLTKGTPLVLSNLAPDNYFVSVGDGSPLIANFNAFLQINDVTPGVSASVTSSANNTDPTCSAPNGFINVSVSGGSGSYTYAWTASNGFTSSSQNISGLNGGTYNLAITDNNANCSFALAPIVLTDPLPNVYSITTTTPSLCSGSTYVINVSNSDVGVTYTVLVNGTPTTTTAVGTGAPLTINYNGPPSLANGDLVTVRAALGLCTPVTMNNTLTAVVNPKPTSATLSAVGPTTICAGSSTTIKVVIVSGTPNFNFPITNGPNEVGYVTGSSITVSPAVTTTYDLTGVTVTDSKGCTVVGTGSVTVIVNPIPTATIAASPSPICSGSSSTLTFTLTGTGPFNVTYTDGVTPVNLVGISNGHTVSVSPASTTTYTITAVTDATTCVGVPGSNATVTVNPKPTSATLSAVGPTTICAGSSTTIKVDVVSGTPNFDFAITNGPNEVGYVTGSAITVSPAVTTTYDLTGVTVTDSKGCTVVGTGSVTVIVNPIPTATIAASPSPICSGSSSTLTFTLTGTGPFNVTYTDGVTPVNLVGISNGHTVSVSPASTTTYTITAVTDATTCVGVPGSNATVTVNPKPTSATLSAVGPTTICAGNSTTIKVDVVSGTPNFDFAITNGPNEVGYVTGSSITVSPAVTTTYDLTGVTVTDSKGCTVVGTGSVTVIVNPIPTATIAASPSPICSGSSSTLTFTLTGTGPFNVTYTDGVTPVNLVGIATGHTVSVSPAATTSYTITAVTDATTCVGVPGSNATVTVNPKPTSATLSAVGPTTICAGSSTTIKVDVVSGTPNFDFAITNGPNEVGYVTGSAITVSPAVTTTYDLTGVTVTDSKGCTVVGTGSVTVIVNPIPTATIAASPSPICSGSSSALTFTLTGTGPFNVTYTDGVTPVNLVGISNGHTVSVSPAATTTYTITAVSDANCTGAAGSAATVTVNPSPTSAVLSGDNTICKGTSTDLTVTITGGVSPYNFTINNGVGSITSYVSGTAIPVTPLASVTYSIVGNVTDANGCPVTPTGTAAIIVNVAATPTLTGPAVACQGSSGNNYATDAGMSAYNWTVSAGGTIVNNNGDNVDIDWNAAGPQTVSVSYTDASGCVTAATIYNVNVANLTVTPTITANTNCPTLLTPYNGAINLAITGAVGPLTISWTSTGGFTSASQNISNLAPDDYNVTVFDPASHCSVSLSVLSVIDKSPALTVSLASLTNNDRCLIPFDGAVSINVATTSPPLISPTYAWSAASSGFTAATQNISNVPADTYTVLVTDPTSGCTGTQSFAVLDNTPTLLLSTNPTDNTNCVAPFTGSIDLTVAGGGPNYTYAWTKTASAFTSNAQNLTALDSGKYNVLVTDVTSGCTATLNGTIVANSPTPITGDISGNATICSGQSTNLTFAFTGVGPTYDVTYTDGTTNFLAAGVANGGTVSVSPAASVSYTIVKVKDNGSGCVLTGPDPNLTGSAGIIVNPSPTGSISGTTSICPGQSTNLSFTLPAGTFDVVYTDGTSNFTLSGISNGATASVTPAVTTTYTIFSIKDNTSSCLATAPSALITGSAVVTIFTKPTASISGPAAVCSGTLSNLTVTFTGATPWTFSFTDGTTTFNNIVANFSPYTIPITPLSNTTYTLLSVKDANCTGTLTTSTVTVNVDTPPNLTLAVSAAVSPLCTGGSTTIDVANSELGVTYQLRDASNTNIGVALVGNGGTRNLPTGVLNATTTFNVLATRGVCTPTQLNNTATVTVAGSINSGLTVSPLALSVCTGSSTLIQVAASENGVTYQLRNNATNALIGSAVAGTGATINLPTGNLAVNTTFNILATNGTCSVQLTNLATVNVDINPNTGLTVGAALNPLCIGGSTQVTVSLSEVGVSYQLRDHLNTPIGAAVVGTGGTINLPTGVLNSNETFNVLATSGACVPVQLTNTVSITVSGSVNAGLTVTPVSSTICSGSNADIQVFLSEIGVNYQLVNSATNANVGAAVAGTGATIDLFANGLLASSSYYIIASNGSCSIQLTNTASITVNAPPTLSLTTAASINPVCTGGTTTITVANSELNVSYQLRDASNTNIGAALTGNGGTLSLPTNPLAANTTFNVLATSGVCTPAQLTNTVAVTVSGNINTGLTIVANPSTICSGTATFVQVQSSIAGVTYQLRDNSNNTPVGVAVVGTGATINLSTGNINTTTTYNVLATNGTCSAQMTALATVTVNLQPNKSLTVTAQNGSVCTGTGTNIQIAASEVGVSYQLRDNSNNSLIGSAVAGNGGSINLPTGNLASTTTFNVFATGGGACTAQLTTTVTVTVLLASNPLCSGGGGGTGTCATVVITPTPSPATCTNSDGQINFLINPAVPAVNNVGVSITIQGISTTNNTVALTNFNNPVFTNIPVGVYTYSIIYGDPSCTKSGQVTVDQSGTVGTPTASNPVNATCFGSATGAVTLDVAGETGNLLQWSVDGLNWNNFTVGNQITGVPAGAAPSFTRVISVRRNASDPCNASVLVTISQPADITTTFTVQDASCTNNDGTIQVGTITGGTGAYTYRLDSVDHAALPANNTFTGLPGGLHKFTIIDANGCSKYFKVTVNFPGLVNFTTLVTGPDCSGSGNNGSVVATITSSGTFNIGITTDPLNDPTTMQTVVSAGSTPVTFTGLSQGIYYVVAKPVGALCPTRTLVSMSGGPTAVDFNLKPKNYTCFETLGKVDVYGIKGSGAVPYSYEIISQGNVVLSGSITQNQALDSVFLSPLASGSYQVHLFQDQSASSGCAAPISSAFKSFTITGPTATLDTLFVTRTPSLLNHPTGSMKIGIKESNEQPYQVMLQLIDPQIQGQKNHQLFDSVWVNVPRNNTTLKIEFDANNLYAGDYRLFIRDTVGCVKTYDLVNNKAYIGFDQNLFIPNIFTPNNDGKNETFYIINLPATGASLVITNRWGKEVFHSSNYDNKWDGGAESDGVYFYRLNTGKQVFTGWVEILRSTN